MREERERNYKRRDKRKRIFTVECRWRCWNGIGQWGEWGVYSKYPTEKRRDEGMKACMKKQTGYVQFRKGA